MFIDAKKRAYIGFLRFPTPKILLEDNRQHTFPGLIPRFIYPNGSPASLKSIIFVILKRFIMAATIIIVALIVLIVFWLIGLYNRLVRYRNNRENAFADIDVQLRQRNDLIPQLVSTVKGYAAHEKDLLERITQARSAVMSAGSINDKIQADTQLTQALQGLRVSVEAYPDLKANTNFLQLQKEISDIENKLAAARRYFNGATRELNNAVESFPGNLMARSFGFSRQPMYELSAEQRTSMEAPPQINF